MQNLNRNTNNNNNNIPSSQLRNSSDYYSAPYNNTNTTSYMTPYPHETTYTNLNPASPTSPMSPTSPTTTTSSSSYRMPLPPLIILSPDITTSYANTPSTRPITIRKRYYAQKHDVDGHLSPSSPVLEKGEEESFAKTEAMRRRDTGSDLSERRRSLEGKERIRKFSLKLVGLGR